MDIRRCTTKYGLRMHKTAMDDAEGLGKNGDVTFCHYATATVEPETEGHIREWDDREREMVLCIRCDKAIQRLAEA